MIRQVLLRVAFLAAVAVAVPVAAGSSERPPNIILIMTDDLGVAETGATGSTLIRTPNLDRLAAEGMQFTQAYSGSTVCAPSRCTLLTGLHTGHAQVRGNGETPNFTGDPGAEGTTEISGWTAPPMPSGWWGGQKALAAGTETLAGALKRDGYATFATGKWGLGGPMSEGLPTRQGFDGFIGYLCQRNAHNYYPTYLAKDESRVMLDGNDRGLTGKTYATDLMIDAAVEFIDQSANTPFFLYYATPVPHLALQVPEDSLAEYSGQWEDKPYTGKSYLPHPEPRAAYAAMVTRMDRNVGRILAAVRANGLDDNTIVIFTSDNGSTFDLGGYDPEFFNGTGGLRGHKCNLYEGGIRVPLFVRWPNMIEAGSSSDVPVANWDFFPTIMGLTGATAAAPLDGIDFSPVLLGAGDAPKREALYWEYHPGGGRQAVRMGQWKGVRNGINKNPNAPVLLFNLASDPNETTNVAKANPAVAARILEIMHDEHEPSTMKKWNFPDSTTDDLAPPPIEARLDLPGAPGFTALKKAYERSNPDTTIDFIANTRQIPVRNSTRVAFIQKGEGDTKVGSFTSPFRVGDFLALRPGDDALFNVDTDVVIFAIKEPFDDAIPRIIRADFDPKLSDTPGGCATDEGAYRRLLLTWDPARGPYVHHGLNCHRVRIDDSFTHYHPVDGGWDELYLVQGAPQGATLLTSRFTKSLEREEDIGSGEQLRQGDVEDLLVSKSLHNGSLILLPRGLVHRGLGGAVVQVIAVPGFKPGFEIPMDRAIQKVNGRFALTGGRALPLHEAGVDRKRPQEK